MTTGNIRSIVLFGFSGSGKSTMADALATRYCLRPIHPSSIMRDILSGRSPDLATTVKNTGYWESDEGMAFLKARLHDDAPLDMCVDRLLIDTVRSEKVIIDSWSLPWHAARHGLLVDCIYLKADLFVRAHRVSARDSISYVDAAQIIAEKDDDTRRLFARIYGFDIARDHDVFNAIINTDILSEQDVFSNLCVYFDEKMGYRK